jgi:hypothetical protein
VALSGSDRADSARRGDESVLISIRAPSSGENGDVIDGDPLSSATPDILQRAAHLAVLRILALQRQEDLDRLTDEADVLVRRGYVLDPSDACARVQHLRERSGMDRRLAAAASELQEASTALRQAILDDAWRPSDDLDVWPL